MSRRRGAPSMDPLLIERRQWYADMEREAWQPKLDVESSSQVETVIEETTLPSALPTPVPPKPMSLQFTSTSLMLAEESLSRQNVKEVADIDIIPPYIRPSNFNPNKWISKLNYFSPLQPGNSVATLICFHCMCGKPDDFKKIAMALESIQIYVIGICLPGRGSRMSEDCMTSAHEAASSCAEALRDLNIFDVTKTTDVILLGISMGAIIAFELAHIISKWSYVKIKHLIVAGCRAPAVLTQFNRDRFGTKYYCASDKELMDKFISFGGIPSMFRERKDILKLFMKQFRKDYELLEKYKCTHNKSEEDVDTLDCPIMTLGVTDDLSVSSAHLTEWYKHTSGSYVEYFFPNGGGQSFWRCDEHEQLIIRFLRNIFMNESVEMPEQQNDDENNGTY